MKLNTMRKLGLAGALAIAGLLLAPLAASAEVNKCAKEVSKNAAKAATDVQKELQKCVDGWLKDEDKVAANLGKGKTNWLGEGESSGLNKAAAKCEKRIAKIGMTGIDVATLDGATEKTKLGKTYQKLAAALSVIGAKPKCGIDPTTKAFNAALRDDELYQLGWLKVADVGDVSVRLMVAGGVANGWDTTVLMNTDTSRVFQEMGNDRCSLSGVACDDSSDCDPAHPKGSDICVPSNCPDCLKFARAVDSSVGTPVTVCSDDSPSNVGGACADETSCGGTVGVTDHCDTAPSQGATAGPCHMGGCNSDNSNTGINLEGTLEVAGNLIQACDDPFKPTGHQCPTPGAPQCCAADGNFGIPIQVALKNMNPNKMCQIEEVLPNAVAIVGGPARGIKATVVLNSTPVCVDSVSYHGYIDKGTTMPQFNVVACADVDDSTDQSGAPSGADGCGTLVNCEPQPVDDPNNPGSLLHTGVVCQDLVPQAVAVGGHALFRNDQILSTGTAGVTADACSVTALIAAGEPTPLTLTTLSATGDMWDIGPLVSGGSVIDSGDFHIENFNSGTPFDVNKLAGGALDGALVSAFGTVATNPAASIGAQMTGVILDCQD